MNDDAKKLALFNDGWDSIAEGYMMPAGTNGQTWEQMLETVSIFEARQFGISMATEFLKAIGC